MRILVDYVKNPILQYFCAVYTINQWIKKIRNLQINGEVIIYLNGRMSTTICIYLQSAYDQEFLENFDKQLRISEVIAYQLPMDDNSKIFRPRIMDWNPL